MTDLQNVKRLDQIFHPSFQYGGQKVQFTAISLNLITKGRLGLVVITMFTPENMGTGNGILS